MDIGQRRLPEWLEAWLNVPFYEEKCRNHPKKHKTVYCGECMEGPLCHLCWEQTVGHHHLHHRPILQVRIASRKAATDVKDMRGLLDTSEIQIYNINHKKVVYLNPFGKCLHCSPKQVCEQEFCSIACKFIRNEVVEEPPQPKIILKLSLKPLSDLSRIPNLDLEFENENENEIEDLSLMERENEGPSSTESFRKRSRKGTPRRGANPFGINP